MNNIDFNITPNELMCMLELVELHDSGMYEDVVGNVNDYVCKIMAYDIASDWLFSITGFYDGVLFDPMWRW